MAQEFRVLRPDLPGLGRSRIPAGFAWTLPSLAAFVARVLDKAGVDTAHVIGAKAGSNSKSRHLGRSHSIFWVFISSGGMTKVVRASRKTGQEGKTA